MWEFCLKAYLVGVILAEVPTETLRIGREWKRAACGMDNTDTSKLGSDGTRL